MSSLHTLDITNSTADAPVHVLPEVFEIYPEIVENRRWFHAHAELSFEEVQTAKHIVEVLKSYGIEEIYEGVGLTGVVGIIRGGKPGPCIALRADIDALSIIESADIDYKSQNEGAMHACGHDGHITGLLAAARLLWKERESLAGTVKLLFQPAEEGFKPGEDGYGGAREMIKAGVLEEGPLGPKVDEVYGIHLISFMPLGWIGCEEGPVLAAADIFTINVKGRGGHGAAPQFSVDAIVEAATVVTSLQTIISRNKDPLESGVLTCGTIKGGFGFNIIADQVEICGTCRSFTPQVQDMIKTRMNDICCGVAKMYGGEIDLDYKYIYPPTINSYPECNAVVIKATTPFVGRERASKPQKMMGGEDFSYFLQQRPGCFFFVGCALPGERRPHHKSVFDFDERAMMISASAFIQIIRDKLKQF